MPTGPYDRAWLLDIRNRLAKGENCDAEIRAFLRSVRDLGRTVIGRTSRHALALGHEEDILALSDASFVGSGIQRYRGDASPQSYFATIVTRWTVSYLRPMYRREEALAPSAIAELQGGVSTHADVELRHDIAAALLKLFKTNASHAEAFSLYYLDEFGSDAECGASIGIDAEAFRKRRERAKSFLRSLLDPGEEGQ